jgi:hypothetical protein
MEVNQSSLENFHPSPPFQNISHFNYKKCTVTYNPHGDIYNDRSQVVFDFYMLDKLY